MSSQLTLDKFDCEGEPSSVGTRWERWKRALLIYLEAAGIESCEKKRASLLHYGGLELQEIFYNIPGANVPPADGVDVFEVAITNLPGANRQRYNVYESYGNLFPPNRGASHPPRRGRGQTRSRQGFQTARVENKRRTEGAKTTVGIDAMIKSTLHPGVKSGDDLLARIGENHNLKTINLTITTRGIGFGLCHLNYIAVSYHEIVVPNVYAQYRVFLAVLEAKLESLKTAYPLPARNTDLVYNYQVNADLLKVAQTVTVAPEPIKRLINAVGIISYDEGIYIPAVSRAENDDRGRFIPQTQNILFSSLRRTVVALADPATPERYRRRFIENNPIPGVIWHNNLLQNPDEIIPANYNNDNLRDDIASLSPYLNKLQKHIPKMVDGTIDFKTERFMCCSTFCVRSCESLVRFMSVLVHRALHVL